MNTTAAVLYAPTEYWSLPKELKQALTNGCGPRGWLRVLVPDTICGLDITKVCDIHDYMYAIGVDEADREEADDVFRNNLLRWVDAHTKWNWLKKLRYHRAQVYYKAVRNFGGPAFWKDKNPSETMMPVFAK